MTHPCTALHADQSFHPHSLAVTVDGILAPAGKMGRGAHGEGGPPKAVFSWTISPFTYPRHPTPHAPWHMRYIAAMPIECG